MDVVELRAYPTVVGSLALSPVPRVRDFDSPDDDYDDRKSINPSSRLVHTCLFLDVSLHPPYTQSPTASAETLTDVVLLVCPLYDLIANISSVCKYGEHLISSSRVSTR